MREPTPSMGAMLDALDQARAIDFVSYVNRRLREDESMKNLSFGTGWDVVVGGYSLMAAQVNEPKGDES